MPPCHRLSPILRVFSVLGSSLWPVEMVGCRGRMAQRPSVKPSVKNMFRRLVKTISLFRQGPCQRWPALVLPGPMIQTSALHDRDHVTRMFLPRPAITWTGLCLLGGGRQPVTGSYIIWRQFVLKCNAWATTMIKLRSYWNQNTQPDWSRQNQRRLKEFKTIQVFQIRLFSMKPGWTQKWSNYAFPADIETRHHLQEGVFRVIRSWVSFRSHQRVPTWSPRLASSTTFSLSASSADNIFCFWHFDRTEMPPIQTLQSHASIGSCPISLLGRGLFLFTFAPQSSGSRRATSLLKQKCAPAENSHHCFYWKLFTMLHSCCLSMDLKI